MQYTITSVSYWLITRKQQVTRSPSSFILVARSSCRIHSSCRSCFASGVVLHAWSRVPAQLTMSTVLDLTTQGSAPAHSDTCASAQPPKRRRARQAPRDNVVDLTVDNPLLTLPPARAVASPAVEIVAVRRRRREQGASEATSKRARPLAPAAPPPPSPADPGPRCGVCLENFKDPACGVCGYVLMYAQYV